MQSKGDCNRFIVPSFSARRPPGLRMNDRRHSLSGPSSPKIKRNIVKLATAQQQQIMRKKIFEYLPPTKAHESRASKLPQSSCESFFAPARFGPTSILALIWPRTRNVGIINFCFDQVSTVRRITDYMTPK